MSNKALSSKNGVGWSRWPRIAQWLVLKAATGKKVVEWSEVSMKIIHKQSIIRIETFYLSQTEV